MKSPLATNYRTGRKWPTAPIAGPDGWEFDLTVPAIGLASAAGDGTNASSVTDDWYDDLLLHIFGTQTTTVGEGVGTGSTTSSLVLDTDSHGLQDMIPVYEASLTTPDRSQWALITSDPGSGTYSIAPTLDNAPTTTAVGYGIKFYTFDDDGGPTLAFVYREDELDYTLLGGRCTQAALTIEAGKKAEWKITFRGDNRTQESKGSLPSAGAAPSNTPLVGLRSPVWFNNTKYETTSIEIDLGIQSAVRPATSGANGRGGDELIVGTPVVTIHPLRTDAILALKRNQTAGRLLAQIGAGIVSGGVLNSNAFHLAEATAQECQIEDENGRLRDGIKFTMSDPVTTGGASARVAQFARA